MMRTEVISDAAGAQVSVIGMIDVHSVADVRIALAKAIAAGRGDLTVQLGAAEIGDATGLGVLVGAHKLAQRAGRRLVLAEQSARLDRLLRATKLSRVIATAPRTALADC